MRPPVVEENGYVTTFVRRRIGGRPRWVHACRLAAPGPWPEVEGGWFLWRWELAHEWYLGIRLSDWERMPRIERMRAELQLQVRIWIPDEYAPQSARLLDPVAYDAWDEDLDWNTVCAQADPDTHLDRPYGPGPEMRYDGAHWRDVLRARGWPIPAYDPPPLMPFSLREARRREIEEWCQERNLPGSLSLHGSPPGLMLPEDFLVARFNAS